MGHDILTGIYASWTCSKNLYLQGSEVSDDNKASINVNYILKK